MNKVLSVKQLVAIGNSYDFDDGIPFKMWVETAYQILIRAEETLLEGSYSEAYILFSRFCEGINRQSLTKLMQELPNVLARMESLKPVIDRAYQEYVRHKEERRRLLIQNMENMKKQRQLEEARQLRDASASDAAREATRLQANLTSGSELAELKRLLSRLNSTTNVNQTGQTGQTAAWQTHPTTPGVPSYPTIPAATRFSPQADLSTPSVKFHPELPEKSLLQPPKEPVESTEQVYKPKDHTEGGKPLRNVFLPKTLKDNFLALARPNTRKKIETCGILCGVLNRNAFFVTHLVLPQQEGTSDTCTTKNEEQLFEYVDSNDLFIIGWIHTHPTQSCFLSSIDLHTQNSYQIMLPEAIAIVCAPKHEPSWGIFRLTDPPGVGIVTKCTRTSFHPHPEKNLYKSVYFGDNTGGVMLHEEIPLVVKDFRV